MNTVQNELLGSGKKIKIVHLLKTRSYALLFLREVCNCLKRSSSVGALHRTRVQCGRSLARATCARGTRTRAQARARAPVAGARAAAACRAAVPISHYTRAIRTAN